MKKIICILAIVFFITGCDNNEKITTVIQTRDDIAYLPNSDEPFTGRFEGYYPNGQKKNEIHLKDGKINGLSITWDENGLKEAEVNFKDGKRNGIMTMWYKNGQKKNEVNYIDDKENGISETWYENGQKKQEANYIDGKENGIGTMWHENGQKMGELNFKDGKKNGSFIGWYENGQKSGEANFIDGKANGLSIRWYKNGQKMSEVNFKDDKENGLGIYGDENGQKTQELNYIDGKAIVLNENGGIEETPKQQVTTQPEPKARSAEVADSKQSMSSESSPLIMVMRMLDFAMNDGGLSDESQIQAMKLQIEELPKPIKGQKKSARIHNEQGLSYFNDGELEKAVKLFKEASQLDKSDPEILNNLGYALLKQGNVESAEDAILETLAIAPGRATAWQNLGDILAIKNDMPKAIAVYENVYRFSKNRVKTHQFMQKLNVNEDVSSLKQARQMAMNWAKKTYPEINE